MSNRLAIVALIGATLLCYRGCGGDEEIEICNTPATVAASTKYLIIIRLLFFTVR